MKFNNRLESWLNKGWYVQIERQYYQIIHVEWTHTIIDLLTLLPGGGPLLSTAPLTAPIRVPQLESKYYNVLVQVLPSVIPEKVAIEAEGVDNGVTQTDVIEERSAQLFYNMPQEQPRWFLPTSEGVGFTDHNVSQPDDPAEDFAIWLMHNDEPHFRILNSTGIDLDEVNVDFRIRQYIINPKGRQRPPNVRFVTPIPYSRSFIAQFSDRPKVTSF